MRSLFDHFLSRYYSFLIMSLFLQQSMSSEFGIEVSRCYNWSLVIKFRMNSIPHHIGGGLTSIAYGNDFISHKAICKSCFCKLVLLFMFFANVFCANVFRNVCKCLRGKIFVNGAPKPQGYVQPEHVKEDQQLAHNKCIMFKQHPMHSNSGYDDSLLASSCSAAEP